jgi:hypothetical protein
VLISGQPSFRGQMWSERLFPDAVPEATPFHIDNLMVTAKLLALE